MTGGQMNFLQIRNLSSETQAWAQTCNTTQRGLLLTKFPSLALYSTWMAGDLQTPHDPSVHFYNPDG